MDIHAPSGGYPSSILSLFFHSNFDTRQKLSQNEFNLFSDSPIGTRGAEIEFGRGIVLYGSNDPDVLIARCAEDLKQPLSDPFTKEEFLVQSRGMSSWIKLQLADRLGIFANIDFRFPEETIWMILRGFLGEGPERNPFTKEAMSWKIFDLLPDLLKDEGGIFAPVARYVGTESGGTFENADRTFRLCRQIASLYDSYQTYRPEMIMDWNAGKINDQAHPWQGILWKAMHQALGQDSLPELVQRLQKIDSPAREDWLPERLSVFGISTLPPIFLDILQVYGSRRPLRIYALQPAPVMWGEVESEKTLQKWKARALERAKELAERKVEESELSELSGNPLIGSLGRTGREFFNLLVDRDAHDVPLEFRDPKGDKILARLQRWTFEVFSTEPEKRLPYSEEDESIVINNCHGPMRETEVLRDYLLRRFSEDPTLLPRDIVVMMPNPESYAPYIRATFGGTEEGMPEYFPFSIVDREPRQESLVVDCFFDLLEFFERRATNREVLDLLDSSIFRKRFELEDDDIEVFRSWIRSCHAHWGFDGEHRARFGSVKSDEHTWRHALERMALGYCMHSNDERMWGSVLPFDEIEGENAKRFGKLYKVIDGLGRMEQEASKDKSLQEWTKFLEKLTDFFFTTDNLTFMDRRRVHVAVNALSEEYFSLAESLVPLRVIRYHLSNVLNVGTTQGQFLTAGVTFCGLRPMRSVNARVICLIGMNEGVFPRHTQKPSFDLSGKRRAGDRSAREDDRYLFLETLWCAREHLYLSFVGQSIRQNQQIPPSVVINELLEAVDKLVDFEEKEGSSRKARDVFVQLQSLHPFGTENFTGKKLPRSFSIDNLEGALASIKPDAETAPFSSKKMQGSQDELTELSVEQLSYFLVAPAEYFLRHSIGMYLRNEDPPPEECEPFELGNLQKYIIKDRLLRIALNFDNEADLLSVARAEGGLPPGSLGELWFNEAKGEVADFVSQWGQEITGKNQESLVIDVEFEGLHLHGELDSFINGRQVLYRCVNESKGKDRLKSWVNHLFASAFGKSGVETRFYSSEKKPLCLEPLPSELAREIISHLIGLFRRGMQEPLAFFPESSYAYAKRQISSETDISRNRGIIDARKNGSQGAIIPEREMIPPISFVFVMSPLMILSLLS